MVSETSLVSTLSVGGRNGNRNLGNVRMIETLLGPLLVVYGPTQLATQASLSRVFKIKDSGR